MTISDKLKILQDALVSVAPDITYHYRRPSGLKRFIVWAEQAEEATFTANNSKAELRMLVSIDLYTQTEYDSLIDAVEEALDASDHITATVEVVDYEDETALIHYTWRAEVS